MDGDHVVEARGPQEVPQLARPDTVEAEQERRGDAQAVAEPVRSSPEGGRFLENPVVESAAPLVEARMDQLAKVIHHGRQGSRGPQVLGERLGHPGMARAVGGGEEEDAGRGFRHGLGRLATSRVSLPACAVSPRWFTMRRSSMTTPPSRMERFVCEIDTLRMVSPTRMGRRKRHSKPMKASTASGGRGTRHPSPEERQSGSRSGTSPGSRGAVVRASPLKSATWASVTVMPGVSSGTLSSMSSK